MPTENHQVRLAARPRGLPTPDVWEHTTEEVADPGPGQFLVKVEYLSLDPAMRGWMNEGRSYIPPALITREQVVEGGVEAFPDALLKLFRGENTGKLVLKLT